MATNGITATTAVDITTAHIVGRRKQGCDAGQRAEPRHRAPRVVRAAEHRHAGERLESAAEASANGANSAMRRAKRRQYGPINPGQRRQRSLDAGEDRRQTFLTDGIRCCMAGEPQDEPVLWLEHRPSRVPGIRLGLAQPQQPRQRMEPVEMLRFRVVRHSRKVQRLPGRPVCPGIAKPDGGSHGAPPGVEEDLSARRTAGDHRRQAIEPAARCQSLDGIGEGAPPSVGVLLGAAGPVLVEPDREGDRRRHHPFEGEQPRFQRRSPEIDGQDPTHEDSLLVAASSENAIGVEGSPEAVRQVKAGRSAGGSRMWG